MSNFQAAAQGPLGRATRAKKITIGDIAALAGVDKSTVSRALNPSSPRRVAPATRDRIRRVAEEQGYVPDTMAAGLRRGKTESIGILVADITDPHTASLLRIMTRYLAGAGVAALVMETQDQSNLTDSALTFMTSRRVDAVIVLSARDRDAEQLVALSEICPVVLCIRGLSQTELPSITCDDYAGGALAAGYLAQLGHQNVAILACEADIATMRRRRDGFYEMARSLSMQIVELAGDRPSSFDQGRALASQLLASGRSAFSAIFAVDDPMAMGAISALNAAGLGCPKDVSVVGFDDSPLCEFLTPALTTVSVPVRKIGEEAAVMALRLAGEHTDLPAPVVVRPDLSVRSSTRSVL